MPAIEHVPEPTPTPFHAQPPEAVHEQSVLMDMRLTIKEMQVTLNGMAASVPQTNQKIEHLTVKVAELSTRLDHPDPQLCTQQESIHKLEANDLELFHRINALEVAAITPGEHDKLVARVEGLEAFKFRLLGGVAVASAVVTLALSWVGKWVWELWQTAHAAKGAVK